MFCSQCGKKLREVAKFCHACGAETQSSGQVTKSGSKTNSKSMKVTTQSWLNSFGAFLFIPIFALIIVLLFWVNNDPEPITAGTQVQSAAQGNGTADKAVMQQVHNTLENLKSRLEADPEDLVAIDSLAVMYAIAGSYDKAKEYYEMHLEIEPDNQDIKIGLALTQANLQQTDNAITIIEEVLSNDPTYVFGLYYLAEIYASIHEHEKAIEKWNLIVEGHPNSDFSRMALKRIKEQSHADE